MLLGRVSSPIPFHIQLPTLAQHPKLFCKSYQNLEALALFTSEMRILKLLKRF